MDLNQEQYGAGVKIHGQRGSGAETGGQQREYTKGISKCSSNPEAKIFVGPFSGDYIATCDFTR